MELLTSGVSGSRIRNIISIYVIQFPCADFKLASMKCMCHIFHFHCKWKYLAASCFLYGELDLSAHRPVRIVRCEIISLTKPYIACIIVGTTCAFTASPYAMCIMTSSAWITL